MTESIKDRNAKIRSLYLKMKNKNKWRPERIVAILKRIYRRKWNISETTIQDIVGRK